MLITLLLFGCGGSDESIVPKQKVAIVEHELSAGTYTHMNEENIIILSLEHEDTNEIQGDLLGIGSDCFLIKPTKDFDNIILEMNQGLMIHSISIEDMSNNEMFTLHKDETAVPFSLKAGNSYEYCVTHDNSKKENQTLFVRFELQNTQSRKFTGNQEDLDRVSIDKNCTSTCDLTGASLQDFDLSYLDLSSAKMQGANLIDADLTHAILVDTHLSSVQIAGAKFDYAIIAPNRDKFTFASIENASFVGSKLSTFIKTDGTVESPIYDQINFSYTNLSTLDILARTFTNCTFQDTNFTNANLTRSKF